MKTSSRIVWLGYASIVLSLVWGVPGLVAALYALRMGRGIDVGTAGAVVRRDVRGGMVLARIGLVLSAVVIVMVCWSWISTALE